MGEGRIDWRNHTFNLGDEEGISGVLVQPLKAVGVNGDHGAFPPPEYSSLPREEHAIG
jgi:hypothetical protein